MGRTKSGGVRRARELAIGPVPSKAYSFQEFGI